MFNWVFNRFYFLSRVLHQSRDFPRVTSVWGVSVVAILYSSVNCVCVWSTKKLTMPAYCVAAICNNLQTTTGITMHELQRNRAAVRWKWIKFIQSKQTDFLAAPHHAHLCSEHFSECDFANHMEYRMGFASKLTRCSSTLSKSCLTGSNWYGCILAGSLWQSIRFIFGARVGHFAATPQSDVVGIWSWWRFRYDRKWLYFVHLWPSDHSFTYIIVLSEL